VTTRFSPLNRKHKLENQKVRYAIQALFFASLLAYQLYFFVSGKPKNYYEHLSLPGIFVEEHQIHDYYSTLQKNKKASDSIQE